MQQRRSNLVREPYADLICLIRSQSRVRSFASWRDSKETSKLLNLSLCVCQNDGVTVACLLRKFSHPLKIVFRLAVQHLDKAHDSRYGTLLRATRTARWHQRHCNRDRQGQINARDTSGSAVKHSVVVVTAHSAYDELSARRKLRTPRRADLDANLRHQACEKRAKFSTVKFGNCILSPTRRGRGSGTVQKQRRLFIRISNGETVTGRDSYSSCLRSV